VGALALPESGRVYVDTNVVIHAVEHIEPYTAILQPLWLAAKTGQVTIVTSELTWLETLTKPMRDGDLKLETIFRELLTAEEVTLVSTTLPLWEHAARLRGLGLKTPDAVHAATALATSCGLFLTNDTIFQRIDGLPVTVLRTLLTS
jgi:predicted nucleic acid-binding protein